MPRWRDDDVDVAAKAWADLWVRNFARAPDRSSATVGPLGSTLGRVRELHDGASSNTSRDRHFPEVFTGEALLVAIALKAMSEGQRMIVHAHYIGRWYNAHSWARLERPVKQAVMADRLGLSLPTYHTRRDTAKSCIRVVLNLDSEVLALAPSFLLLSAQVASFPSGNGTTCPTRGGAASHAAGPVSPRETTVTTEKVR